jgi:predicted  nucleic acid-binding Zn-ribbon protein
VAVRLESEVKSIRKDLNHLTKEIERRDSYVEVVKLRTEVDQNSKQVSALWQMANNLRDRFNGK